MRIRSMAMNGFGKFNDRSFDLDRPITLFYGENEAGKSTIMGFIRAMLFGFPTCANMKERYEPLSGGVHGGFMIVNDEAGREFRIERYDGVSQASNGAFPKLRITMEDGTEVDEALLNMLLGQMNANVFNNVFAFSLDELQHFSSLQSDEVSSYIFNAGTGTGAKTLIEAEKALIQQLDQRFRPRGKIQPINVMLNELDASKQRIAESKGSVAQHNERLLALQRIEEAKKQLSDVLALEKEELAWLDKCLRVHEDWTLLQTYKQELEQPIGRKQQVKANKLIWATLGLNIGLPLVFASMGQWAPALISLFIVGAVNGWIAMDLSRQKKQAEQAALKEREQRKHMEEEMNQLDVYLEAVVGAERRTALDKLLVEVDYAELKAQCAKQHDRVKALNEQVQEHTVQLGRGQAELERLMSDEQFRIQQQQHEERIASLQELTSEWATYALCLHLFKQVKHTYEHDKQPTVLQKASSYFAQMTDDRYVRIMAPLGEKTLRVESEDGALVDASYLSRGTVEQLYLAMRFAFADEYASTVALPIVMDDIFVNFDRERLRSSLALLGQLSERHQIILFTCHPHIRDELLHVHPDVQCVSL